MGHTEAQCWAAGGGQANAQRGGSRARGRGWSRGRGRARGRGVHGLEEEGQPASEAGQSEAQQEPEQACSYLEMANLCAAF
eukprot:8364521-Karenia_brevis.AAC.1